MSSAVATASKAVVLLKEFVTHYDENGDGLIDAEESDKADVIARRLDALAATPEGETRVNNYVSAADLPVGQELSEDLQKALVVARDHALANGATRFADNASRFLEIAAQTAVGLSTDAPTAAENLAAVIKSNLTGLTSDDIKSLMRGHLRQLRFIDEDGSWHSPELKKLSPVLLPDIGIAELEALVDRIAINADENPYLHDMLEMAEAKGFADLTAKIQEQGPEVFASVVTYAYVQNELTKAMRDDWHVIETCQAAWKDARKKENIWKEMDLFEKFKFLGVQAPIKALLKHHKNGKVPKNFGNFILPLNIIMANTADKKKGFTENVEAGKILAKHRPGGKSDPETGSGPAHFSEDGKAIEIHMDEAQAWADLYEVWNLAFVSDYKHFPYVMVKLMIDSVSDYQDHPGEFIYDRALALNTHLHFAMFGRIDKSLATEERVQWGSEALTRFLGEVAAQSAEDYELRVAKDKAE